MLSGSIGKYGIELSATKLGQVPGDFTQRSHTPLFPLYFAAR